MAERERERENEDKRGCRERECDLRSRIPLQWSVFAVFRTLLGVCGLKTLDSKKIIFLNFQENINMHFSVIIRLSRYYPHEDLF